MHRLICLLKKLQHQKLSRHNWNSAADYEESFQPSSSEESQQQLNAEAQITTSPPSRQPFVLHFLPTYYCMSKWKDRSHWRTIAHPHTSALGSWNEQHGCILYSDRRHIACWGGRWQGSRGPLFSRMLGQWIQLLSCKWLKSLHHRGGHCTGLAIASWQTSRLNCSRHSSSHERWQAHLFVRRGFLNDRNIKLGKTFEESLCHSWRQVARRCYPPPWHQ
jgi:hypothetical protein